MSRLTKRNATLKASCMKNSTYDCLREDDCITCDCNNKILEKLAHYEDLEEAGRLIEVVRCKDCIRHENSSIEEGYGWCDEHERITGDDDYCSYAISKFEVKAKLAELKEGGVDE